MIRLLLTAALFQAAAIGGFLTASGIRWVIIVLMMCLSMTVALTMALTMAMMHEQVHQRAGQKNQVG